MAKLRNCGTCGYGPVATNALVCPNCGRYSPAPGFFTRWISRIVVLALIVIVVVVVIALMSANGG